MNGLFYRVDATGGARRGGDLRPRHRSAARSAPRVVQGQCSRTMLAKRPRRAGEARAVGRAADRRPSATWRQWLEAALASSKARWKIVIGHHPLWSTAGSKFEQAKVAAPADPAGAVSPRRSLPRRARAHARSAHRRLLGAAGQRTLTPLPQVVSGSAAKMRPINSAFLRHQLQANPQLRTLWARGLAWGFSHLTFEGDRVTVRMLQVPARRYGGAGGVRTVLRSPQR